MGQATFSVRMDDEIKSQFEQLCQEFGMSISTAINVFARAVVRERRIPFEIGAEPLPVVPANPSLAKGLRAFMALRAEAAANGLDDMTLDEINAEISAARAERSAREERGNN